MLDEITYALLNGKIKKIEDNAGGVEKTKLSEFENDLFYNKETVLFSATKDDFQLVNDGAESYYMANLSMNQGYSDDLKLENLELKMTASEEHQSRSFLLKLVEGNQVDGIRNFNCYFPGIDELVGILVPKAKMEQDFSPVYPVEDSAVLMIMPIVAVFAESFTFIHKDIKKIPSEIVDPNEFIATYGVTTYAEIFEATALDKKCYILDSETMTKVPVTSVSEDGIIGNLETFSPNDLQPKMLIMVVNSTNEWFKEKIVIQSAHNMTSDIEDTTPESYPSTEAVRNALQKVLPMPEAASAGQYFRAKSVDEAGKVIEVEAVDGGMPIIEIHPEIDSMTESCYVGRIPVTESAKLAEAAVQKLPVIVKSFLNGLPAGSYVLNMTACDEDIIYYEFETSYYNVNDNVHIVLTISSPQGTMEGEWAFATVISTQTDSLGDIDVALDAILAIQNELIGGEGE